MAICLVHRAGNAFGTTRHPLFRSGLPACTQPDRTGGQNRDQGGGDSAGYDEHVSMMVLAVVSVNKGRIGSSSYLAAEAELMSKIAQNGERASRGTLVTAR